ncbi:MAG: SpoIVB peptidase [Bacillota bacterium]|nr:SpoIVB peptidase [Bacillota bacterium]
MSIVYKYRKSVFLLIVLVCIPILSINLVSASIPNSFSVIEGQSHLGTGLPVQLIAKDNSVFENKGETTFEAKLFGIFPLKNVSINILPKMTLVPGGQTFGVKLFTEGVMVVGVSDIATAEGTKNPAVLAGIKTKDIILTVNGNKVNTIEELTDIFEASDGKAIAIGLTRKGVAYKTEIQPVKSVTDGKFKVGLWVRDSTAGIGTLTFFEPKTGIFAGLGHGICDVDTGDIMPMMSGSVVNADISGVIKGQKGAPGELVGTFDESKTYGDLLGNSETGVYGVLNDSDSIKNQKAIQVAGQSEVKEGSAYILSDVGDGVKQYNIEIVRIMRGAGYSSKNMLIKVTDPELIDKTGGIVQGMSGSPIIQNGKIIGAVTHVLVNDPTRGFGIFIENMLDEMKKTKK